MADDNKIFNIAESVDISTQPSTQTHTHVHAKGSPADVGHKHHVESKKDGRQQNVGVPHTVDYETQGHKSARRDAKEHGGRYESCHRSRLVSINIRLRAEKIEL